MQPIDTTRAGLFIFAPPYDILEPLSPRSPSPDLMPGAACVWFMRPTATLERELAWAAERSRALPLIVVLPPPEEIADMARVLQLVPAISPRGVLPGAGIGTIRALRSLLAAPPTALPHAVTGYLDAAGMIPTDTARDMILGIMQSAPDTSSVEQLASRMCQSRRTLGRYFKEHGLPVPSHWLAFARVVHVALHIQNSSTAASRLAIRFGYPDGYTMSNQMKRMTGHRPSFVREHLGWEWIVESWIRRENRN